ncbi:ABC transporter ATP-binding protein [Pseudonocardia aurantiaca]|uniref:ABC transporter ATP-binding protein n=1 Tax=Pseudonocardia aurantiaca TaxID=75290 RepID=A0ABW4FK68_9PSEU
MAESATTPAVAARRPAEPPDTAGERHSALLSVQRLTKSYPVPEGRRTVVEDLDLDVRPGEIVTIVGPSGAGKTTLLRCIAGLLPASSGQVVIGGRPVTGPPEQLAVVFQDYSRSLMPWLSVRHNVELPLRGKNVPRDERRRRVTDALADVGLGHTAEQHPWQLSGGMQQRVAIARALAYRPQAMLMDEPFASVDAQTRADLEDLVLDLRQRLDITILLVTHDIDEAVYLGDTVVVLGGRPTRVRERLTVPLGRDRDQATTKALPEFVRLRTHILTGIREGAS